ncbi:MAG: two-component regulator propeller domain-containing protein, partial [Blastocatellia bacterium]
TNTPQLKGSRIAALCAGRDGSLWVGTKGGGLVKFSGGAFTLWTTGEGLPDNFVRAICDARQRRNPGRHERWAGAVQRGALYNLHDQQGTLAQHRLVYHRHLDDGRNFLSLLVAREGLEPRHADF